jgi:hypothetical protein
MKEKYQKLVKNLRFYHDNLLHLEWEYCNRYLLIWEEMVVGHYHTYEEAVAEADYKFEPGSFLLKHCKPND